MVALLACLLLLMPALSRADTVHLKNGNQMEGLVVREDSREVELDIGYGTVTLSRADIRRVVRSKTGAKKAAGDDIRRKTLDAGRGVPAQARGLQKKFQELLARRDSALEAKALKAELEEEMEGLNSRMEAHQARYLPAQSELHSRRSAGTEEYNAAVQDLNEIVADSAADRVRLERAKAELEDCRKDIQRYLSDFEEFKDSLEKDDRYSGRAETGPEEQEYYDGIKAMVRRMERDFSSGAAASSKKRGPHVIVQAKLNGKTSASLLVDTGATVVAISRRVFDELRLDAKTLQGEAEVTLADGRRLKAQIALLDSVEVGGMRARRVEAAVLPDSEQGTDGLLGMSFLKNFSFRLDLERNRLVLKALR